MARIVTPVVGIADGIGTLIRESGATQFDEEAPHSAIMAHLRILPVPALTESATAPPAHSTTTLARAAVSMVRFTA